MEFVGNIVDFGNAPEIRISGVARIELASPNIVRVAYYARHVAPDGKIENRIVAYLDWDREIWDSLVASFRAAKAELIGATHEKLFLEAPALSSH